MSDSIRPYDLISPFEINEMFHHKFDGLDFAEPYFLGEFKDDPKQGHITIGVRTPWYDIKYFVYSKASFWDGIATYDSAEDVLKVAVGHLNAAVSMQIALSGEDAPRFDISDIKKYQEDPEGYVEESEPEVEQPDNGRDFDVVYVHHDTNWSELAMMDAENVHFLCDCDSCVARMKRVREYRGEDIQKTLEDPDVSFKAQENQRDRINGSPTVYVNHDNVWTDRTLVEAARVIFLCKCTKCKQHADHILELRREK